MNKKKAKKQTRRSDWTFEVTVSFVQVPPEREAAYWAALKWFAEVILKEFQKQQKEIHNESEVEQSEEKTDRETQGTR